MMMLPLACTEEGTPSGGNGNGGGNEMADCVCPESVRAGKDAVLQWEGFLEGDSLVAVSEDGDEYELTVSYVTSSGMGFNVPVDVPAGRYMLVLVRNERIELGEVEITAPVMPVTGLSVPSSALVGETVLIGGVGYKQGCMVVFTDSEGAESELAATLTNEGISVVLPEDMQAGSYDLYLLQDNLSWLLKEGFTVTEEVVEVKDKDLAELKYTHPYYATSVVQNSWKIDSDDPLTLIFYEYVVSDGIAELSSYDSYQADATGKFVLVNDGMEESNDLEITYHRDGDGNVTASDVLLYGYDDPTTLQWNYNAGGFLNSITYGDVSLCAIEYDGEGNVTTFRTTGFVYSDESLVNSPSAPNVVWAYMAVQGYADPHRYFPYLLGWYSSSSIQLPSAVMQPDPSGSGNIECPLTYEFDADGYVSKMSWSEGSDAHSIEFIYR